MSSAASLSSTLPQSFPGSRNSALERLEAFLPRAGKHYSETRNFDLGPDGRTNVSLLSPYTRYKVLSEQDIASRILQEYSLEDAEKYISEVCWRTYWRGYLASRPSIWRNFLKERDDLSEFHADEYERLTSGKTEVACFDDWAAELKQTGYLHNHARMWFASIWVYHFQLPWQLGAGFFLDHLIGGDPASNTLSWRWVAGLHTQGKHYIARSSNIKKFTKGRFQPKNLELDTDDAPDFQRQPPEKVLASLPDKKEGKKLILLPDDYTADIYLDADALENVLIVHPSACGMHATDLKKKFWDELTSDCEQRLQERYDSLRLEVIHRASELKSLLSDGGWLVYEPDVGPSADLLASLDLPASSVHKLRRSWDSQFFPHCQKGFFGLKKEIPDLLTSLI